MSNEFDIRPPEKREEKPKGSGSKPVAPKEPVESITFAMTKSFHRKLKIAAALDNTSQSKLILRMVEPEIERILAEHSVKTPSH